MVGDGGVRRGVALLLLRLLQAALHGLVDVGRGEGRRPGGPEQPGPEPEHRDNGDRNVEQNTPPAPAGPVPWC